MRFIRDQGLLGSTQTREFNVQATLVQDSTGVYAVTLARDTPFETRRAKVATQLSGAIALGGKNLPVNEVGYSKVVPSTRYPIT